MRDWFWQYGWKFVLALIVVGVALAYIVHLENVANGTAFITLPHVVLRG